MTWTKEEKVLFAKNLSMVAKYYDKVLEFDIAQMIVDDLQGESFTDCMNALSVYRKNPKNRTWPKSFDLIALIRPELDQDAKAKIAATRVIEAVGKFGSWNAIDAQKYIGPLGWQGVTAFGGWQYLCANLGETLNVTTFNAQLRDLCLANNKASEAGVLNQPIGIDAPKENNLISLTTKLVESKKIPQ